MASSRSSSPIRGEPKVMQSGHLVFVKLIFSSSEKVKREATDPPREFPVIINGLELVICITIHMNRTMLIYRGTLVAQKLFYTVLHSKNQLKS